MSRVAVRLGVFGLALAGTFGVAYAVGEALPGGDAPHDQPGEQEHEHGDGAAPVAIGAAVVTP